MTSNVYLCIIMFQDFIVFLPIKKYKFSTLLYTRSVPYRKSNQISIMYYTYYSSSFIKGKTNKLNLQERTAGVQLILVNPFMESFTQTN